MMSREITTVEQLRKFVPILPIVAVVILFACFFLPKSAASIMQVNTTNRQKVYECCVNKSDVSGEGVVLTPDEQNEFLDHLSEVRLKKAIDASGNGFPAIDYVITVTKSNGAVVSAGISTEGFFYLNDGDHYQMQKGSYEELSTFLQGLPYSE